jgi:hypothetical protein
MVLAAAAFRSAALVVVTVTCPAFVVVIVSTYFVPEPLVISQPQPFAAGRALEADDCTVSVMLVRQAEAARIASDTLARMV